MTPRSRPTITRRSFPRVWSGSTPRIHSGSLTSGTRVLLDFWTFC